MGNPLTNNLPPSIDQLLVDVAQMFETISYSDAIDFSKKVTDSDIKDLRRLVKRWKDACQYDDEADFEAIAKDVAKVVKGSKSKKESNVYRRSRVRESLPSERKNNASERDVYTAVANLKMPSESVFCRKLRDLLASDKLGLNRIEEEGTEAYSNNGRKYSPRIYITRNYPTIKIPGSDINITLDCEACVTAKGRRYAIKNVYIDCDKETIDSTPANALRFLKSCGLDPDEVKVSSKKVYHYGQSYAEQFILPLATDKDAMVIYKILTNMVKRAPLYRDSYDQTSQMNGKAYNTFKGRTPAEDNEVYIDWDMNGFVSYKFAMRKDSRGKTCIYFYCDMYAEDWKKISDTDTSEFLSAVMKEMDFRSLFGDTDPVDTDYDLVQEVADKYDMDPDAVGSEDMEEYMHDILMAELDMENIRDIKELQEVIDSMEKFLDRYGYGTPGTTYNIKRPVNKRRAKMIKKHPEYRVLGESKLSKSDASSGRKV